MNFQHGDASLSTKAVRDTKQGFAGIELFRTERDGRTNRVATVFFWDAMGQFFVETLGTDIPLAVLERVIAEAKAIVEV